MKVLAILAAVAGVAALASVSSARTGGAAAPIAFTVRDKGITRLYVIQPDGSRLRQLTARTLPKNFIGDVTPAWSPDGSELVFARNTGRRVVHRYGKLLAPEAEVVGEQLHLFRVAADGGRPTQLTFDSLTYQGTPAYCPDANTIMYVEADAPGVHRGYLYAMRAAPHGDTERTPAFGTSTFGAIVWFGLKCSPDGKTVLFGGTGTEGEEGQWPAAPEASQLLSGSVTGHYVYGIGPNGLSPTWSPDGHRLAWTAFSGRKTRCYAHANLGLFLLGLDPSRPAQRAHCIHNGDLYAGDLVDPFPDHPPAVLQVRNQVRLTDSVADDESPSWSPDSTEIAYASGSQNAGLYAINVQTHQERLIYRPKRGAVTWVAWAPR